MKKKAILILVAGLCLASCSPREHEIRIVPYPNHVEMGRGTYDVKGRPVVCDSRTDEFTQDAVRNFAARLSSVSGGENPVAVADNIPPSGIHFAVDETLAPEAYTLRVNRRGVEVRASQFRGFQYAIQSLKQMLPADIYGTDAAPDASWSVPCVSISDAPRFGYRGMHLDVARHFFGVDEVKRYLDVMAVHKLNTFHWHLTDDQGWRIEIKRFPDLTAKGGFREGTAVLKDFDRSDGVRYGGFYTQDEIREVVDYAARQGITVIPEIDLPGHMLAALTAYPELGCTGGPYKVWHRWGVADDVLCAGNEKTFEFLEGVLAEVIELFPSEYIHIGGDESPKVRWEKCPECQTKIKEMGLTDSDEFTAEHYMQNYVTARMERFLAGHGRRIIGWDEILEGELSGDAVVMSWRGSEGGIQAARRGHDVIMVPNSNFYFDYYQSADVENEPFGIGGYVPVERVYSYDASLKDHLTPAQAAHILGIQANIWTEYIKTPEHLQYMLLPRLAALSEVQWCDDSTKDWDRFLNDLSHICDIYSEMGYTFASHVFDIIGTCRVNPDKSCVELTLATQGGAPIHYTLDGTGPDKNSVRYTAPIEIREGCTVKALVDRPEMKTRMFIKEFTDSKSLGKPAVLNSAPREKYRFAGATLLTDGVYGPFSYGSGEWIGYQDEDMDVTIYMGETEPYSSVTCNMMVQVGDDILPPASLKAYTSEDGTEFTLVGTAEIPAVVRGDKDRLEGYTVTFPATSAPYLRVVGEIAPELPEWHPGHGRKPFIFIDEIAVE